MNSVIVLIVDFGKKRPLIAYSGYVLIIAHSVEHDFHTQAFYVFNEIHQSIMEFLIELLGKKI